nr:hypothetical protein [uncultured Albidiferax sp.]
MLHFKQWMAPAAVAMGLLVACGGGGDGGSVTQYVPGTELPVGVEARVGDVIAFAQAQIADTSDSRDPVLIGNAVLATSESDEPADI